ncbi:MAG: SCP2 sterol-binding domain-containing protein [Pikeienuella sp.]
MFTEEDVPPRMREKVAASDFAHVLKFDCGEDGVIVIDHQNVTTTDKDAECTLRLSKKNLEKLLRGKLNPAMAVATGKVKIDGDMSLALQLAKLL